MAAISFAQKTGPNSRKIDSLHNVIKTAKNDTTVVRAYVYLTEALYPSNPDTILPMSEMVLNLVEKKIGASNPLEKKSYLLTKSAAVANIGFYHFQKGDILKGLEYFEKGLAIQEEIGDKKEIANSLNNIAAIYFKKGETQKSIDLFLRGLAIQKEIGVKEGIAYSLNNLGAIYESQGQIKKALDFYFEGLKLQEETNSNLGMGSSYNNIAALYAKQGETQKALDYYAKSIKVREKEGDKRGIAQCLNNIGHIYTSKNDYTTAFDYFNKSFNLYTEINHKPGIAYSLNNIASLYLKQKQFEKAIENYVKSLALYEEGQDKKGASIALNNIGVAYLELHQPAKAKEYSVRALNIAETSGYAETLRDAHSTLSKIDSASGNSAGALLHYKQYITYRDSLLNQQTRKAAIKKDLQYEYDKKESEAKLLREKEAAVQDEKLKRQKLVYLLASGALVLIMIMVILLFNRQRLKQKNKYQQELNQKQKELAVAVMETQEQERKRIAEDLHDSLGHLLSTIKINLQSLPEDKKTLIENSLQLVNQASEEMRNITFNLMPRTLEEEGLIAALNELTTKTTNAGTVKVLLHVHNISHFVLEKQSQFNIYRIIQEAVNNILKHADAKEINIQIIGQDDHLVIMIEDDGKGFDPGTKKSGRGLKNIVTRSLWLNGHINIDSSPGKGTTITTEIPV